MEHLAALIDGGVRVAIDNLECPLSVLERHLLILVALRDDLLLALSVSGRCVIVVQLQLLLLTEPLCKLLDLPTLLGGYGAWSCVPGTIACPRCWWRVVVGNCHCAGHDPHQLLLLQLWEH
jgi:hypothetical protein